MASYLATSKMLVTLLNPWNLIYLDLLVQIPNMFCFAFSYLKRPPAIIYGNGLTTSPSPKQAIILSGKIFCTKCCSSTVTRLFTGLTVCLFFCVHVFYSLY